MPVAITLLFALLGLVSITPGAGATVAADGLACGPLIDDDIYGRYCWTENGFMKTYSSFDGRFLGFTHGGDPVDSMLDLAPVTGLGHDHDDGHHDDGAQTLGACKSNYNDCPTASGGYPSGARSPHCVGVDSPNPDFYSHVIYVVEQGETNNYATKKYEMRDVIREINGFLHDTTLALGRPLMYKILCDSDGEITVTEEVIPKCTDADCFNHINGALASRGYNDGKVKYWIWTENTKCGCGGKGTMFPDTTGAASNRNNGNAGPMYAVTFNKNAGAVSFRVMMHEHGHNMGAVQSQTDPKNDGGANNKGHCWDGLDIMCYGESGEAEPYTTGICPSGEQWDCENDTYCNPYPDPGSWLDNYWNICETYNRFLVIGNQIPQALADFATVDEDGPEILIDIMANDYDDDPDDEILFHSVDTPGSGATAVWDEEREVLRYRPGLDFNGLDVFEYKIRDRLDPEDDSVMVGTGVVTVDVIPVNDAPVAGPSKNTGPVAAKHKTNEDRAMGLLLDAFDVEGGTMSFEITQKPQYGELTGTAPSLIYTPDPNFYDRDWFFYRVSDGELWSDPGKVLIDVKSVNDDPTAGDDVYFAVTDCDETGCTAVPGQLLPILENDNVDPDDIYEGPAPQDDESFSIDASHFDQIGVDEAGPIYKTNSGGTFQLSDAGTTGSFLAGEDDYLVYTPPSDFTSKDSGMDTLTYKICDTDGSTTVPEAKVPRCKIANVDIDVVDADMVAFPDTYTTDEDTPLVTDYESGVLNRGISETWVDNWPGKSDGTGTARAELVDGSGPMAGSALQLEEDGSFRYSPKADFNGLDSFQYHFEAVWTEDGVPMREWSRPVLVRITVLPVNDPPVANSNSVNMDEDTLTPAKLTASDLEDGISMPLTYEIVRSPASGTLKGIAPDLTYVPDLEFAGVDSFVFRAIDSDGASDDATWTFNVAPLNDVPVALPDNYLMRPDQLNRVSASDAVTRNDYDADREPVLAKLVRQADHGHVVLQENGLFTYQPDGGFLGIDSFTYLVVDAVDAASYPVPVTLQVTPNEIPIVDFRLERLDQGVPISSQQAAVGEELRFIDESYDPDGPITAWIWDFGDGTLVEAESTMHKFSASGVYVVSLTAYDQDGMYGVGQMVVTVVNSHGQANGLPVADAGSPLKVTAGEMVEIQGTSPDAILAWKWAALGSEEIEATAWDKSRLQFIAPTLDDDEGLRYYVFELTVFDGDAWSLPSRVTVTVFPSDASPALSVDAGKDQVTYSGEKVILTAVSTATEFKWVQTDGPPVDLQSDGPVALFTAPYSITDNVVMAFTVTVMKDGEKSKDTVKVHMAGGLAPDLIDVKQDGSVVTLEARADGRGLGEAIQLLWDFGDGETAEGAVVTHAFPGIGTYEVVLSATNNAGYEASFRQTVVVSEETDSSQPVTLADESGSGSMVMVAIAIVGLLIGAGVALIMFMRRM